MPFSAYHLLGYAVAPPNLREIAFEYQPIPQDFFNVNLKSTIRYKKQHLKVSKK